jgi:hypothetical protein
MSRSARSTLSLVTATLLSALSLLGGCASNFECSGGNCTCRSGDCVQDCPSGNCNLMCMGTRCELDCPGGNCNLRCSPGAETCVIRSCTSNCQLECAGAPTCMSSCDALAGCATSP